MNPVKQLFGHLVCCKDVSHLLSRMQEKPLTPIERVTRRWHLRLCAMCERLDAQMRFLHEAMRRYRQ
ncbi:MAG: anti-sigma factor [Burkholderiales bacterium]|nr:anti-sigma factor [Burkholderiales bacterium]